MANAELMMLDDVNLDLLAEYAARAQAIAGYVNGRYANWPAIVQKYERSGKHLVSITVDADPAAGAQCIDIEPGDAAVSQAVAWFLETQKRGRIAGDLRWFPKLYISAGSAQALINAMSDAGIDRKAWRLWSAHYTGSPHICGPGTCGYPQADATQWTSKYQGLDLDASLCTPAFFDGPPTVKPPVPPALSAVPAVIGKSVADAVAEASAAKLRVLDASGKPYDEVKLWVVKGQLPAAGAHVAQGSTVTVTSAPPLPVTPPPVIDPAKPEPPLAEVLFAERVLEAPATLQRPGAAAVTLPKGTVLYIPQEGK